MSIHPLRRHKRTHAEAVDQIVIEWLPLERLPNRRLALRTGVWFAVQRLHQPHRVLFFRHGRLAGIHRGHAHALLGGFLDKSLRIHRPGQVHMEIAALRKRP